MRQNSFTITTDVCWNNEQDRMISDVMGKCNGCCIGNKIKCLVVMKNRIKSLFVVESATL